IVLGVWRLVAQVNACEQGWIAAAVLEDRVALDRIARICLAGQGNRIPEHGNARDGVEGDGVAVPGAGAADQVVAYARLVRLAGAEGGVSGYHRCAERCRAICCRPVRSR